MATIINADTSDGLKLTSDTSGQIDFQSAGSTKATIDTSGNLKFDSGYGSVGTAYGCRAWVNFNGVGVVSIRDSGNVSSITDNGTGNYTINFSVNMPDTNYCVKGTCLGGSTNGSNYIIFGGKNANTSNTQTVSAVQITLAYVASTSGSGGLYDHNVINASIFR